MSSHALDMMKYPKKSSFTGSRYDSSGETEVAALLHLDGLLCKKLECQLQCPRQTTPPMVAAQYAILIVQVIVK